MTKWWEPIVKILTFFTSRGIVDAIFVGGRRGKIIVKGMPEKPEAKSE